MLQTLYLINILLDLVVGFLGGVDTYFIFRDYFVRVFFPSRLQKMFEFKIRVLVIRDDRSRKKENIFELRVKL